MNWSRLGPNYCMLLGEKEKTGMESQFLNRNWESIPTSRSTGKGLGVDHGTPTKLLSWGWTSPSHLNVLLFATVDFTVDCEVHLGVWKNKDKLLSRRGAWHKWIKCSTWSLGWPHNYLWSPPWWGRSRPWIHCGWLWTLLFPFKGSFSIGIFGLGLGTLC